ncbi:MAG: FG-GAP repeat domain-containing protein, partial [Candidatus Thorarchaeota archaeon]
EIGDIDDDPENEVVVGVQNDADNQLRYYEYSQGNWNEYPIGDTEGWLHAVAIGDADNDGTNEVAIGTSWLEGEYELRYYKFESGFWTEHNVANPDISVTGVAIGDLDNDNVNEIAMGLLGNLGFELRYYEYEFGLWVEYNLDESLGECDGIEIADIDNDNQNELVWLGSSLNEALCYYEYDMGAWTKSIIACPTGWEMDTGDVDNDGQLEIAWGNYAEPDNEVRVFNYEAGAFVEDIVSNLPFCPPQGPGVGSGVFHVNIGDLDNDGDNELAVTIDDGCIRYFEYLNGEWFEHEITKNDVRADAITIGDVDNDGWNEVLIGLITTQNEVRYYELPHSESSGVEILFGPFRGNNFKAWENLDNTWNHDVDYIITADAATDIVIVDLDLDGNNEVVVSETIVAAIGCGIIEIFDFDIGISPIHTLVPPSEFQTAAMSLEVCNFDYDAYPEILCGFADGGALMWDLIDGDYQIAQVFPDDDTIDRIAAGNFDLDPESEVVLAVGWDPVLPEVAIYDFDGSTWINLANYSGFGVPGFQFGQVATCDFNMDGIDEIVVSYRDDPLRVLSYDSGSLVCSWISSFIFSSNGFGVGDVTNDGSNDILLRSPYPETELMYLEYQMGIFVNTFNVSVPDMEGAWDHQIVVGDIDRDGQNEFVIGDGPGGIYSTGHLWIYRNDVLLYDTIVEGNDANVVAIGDYDNDG